MPARARTAPAGFRSRMVADFAYRFSPLSGHHTRRQEGYQHPRDSWNTIVLTDKRESIVNIDDMRIVSEASPTRRLVTTKLTEGIVQGRFKPGDRLIERELCEMLGVSRTSLREALRELERDGLIENIPNKGPIVARMSPQKIQGIYEVRAALESLAVRLFTQRAGDDEIAELEAALEELGAAFADFTPERFFAAAKRFYGTLLQGARNETLESALGLIYTRVSQLRLLAI